MVQVLFWNVMVSCVRMIKECAHFTLGENIWSSLFLWFFFFDTWRLSGCVDNFQQLPEVGWKCLRDEELPLKSRRKWFLAFSCIFTYKLVKSSPELLSAAAAGYLLRAFHARARDSRIYELIEERVLKGIVWRLLKYTEMSVTRAMLRFCLTSAWTVAELPPYIRPNERGPVRLRRGESS